MQRKQQVASPSSSSSSYLSLAALNKNPKLPHFHLFHSTGLLCEASCVNAGLSGGHWGQLLNVRWTFKALSWKLRCTAETCRENREWSLTPSERPARKSVETSIQTKPCVQIILMICVSCMLFLLTLQLKTNPELEYLFFINALCKHTNTNKDKAHLSSTFWSTFTEDEWKTQKISNKIKVRNWFFYCLSYKNLRG